jgi:hypothetical protein
MSSARELISSATHHRGGQLRKHAIGLPAILFLLVTSAAPLYAMLFNVPGGINGSGFPRGHRARRVLPEVQPRPLPGCRAGSSITR